MAYATLAEVKARMPELGSTDDSLLTALLDAVTAHFDRVTGKTFAAEAATVRTFTGTGHGRVFIRPTLASAPTQVRVRDGATGSWRIVPLGDVKLMPEGRRTGEPILWLQLLDTPTGTDYVWPESDDSVEVTGTWGRTAVPTDIREACIDTVVNLYRSRGAAAVSDGSGGVYMPDIPKAIPLFAWSILKSYRGMVVA